MKFHSELSTFLLSVVTSLQHLRYELSYHNSYVMPELAVTTQTFCIALVVLQLGFWNRVMLQDWSYHYRSSMVINMNSWIFPVYSSAPSKLICSMCQRFPFLVRLPRTWLLMSNSAGVSRKAEDAYPTMRTVLSGIRVFVPGLHLFDIC